MSVWCVGLVGVWSVKRKRNCVYQWADQCTISRNKIDPGSRCLLGSPASISDRFLETFLQHDPWTMLKLKRRSYHTDGGEGDLFPSMSCSPEEPSSPVSCPQRTIQFLEPPKRARIAHECSPSRVQTSGSRPSLLKKPNPYKIGSGSKCLWQFLSVFQ